ncbi:hypothetical protein Q669_29700 [Labrenzia sp. C1B10]|uniref:DUF2800 domain-containing protein n=1 Tax=unclassified Labrenzia TaxID=2648686 RepID=UPI0003B7E7E3|nr:MULTISPECIES: DUF2800 domain-containing protein [unclassified Labrenzia]ERP95746.1 hypothetical protein Q669_29700 [Labrenzia sp. C1B10]ERS05812.1 hypothetical protein Q675_29265 [Labrenzia sp. C1B70]
MAVRCGNCPSRKKQQHSERAHARLSPSSSSRWLRCAGSVGLIEKHQYPDDPNEAALGGTVLHSFMEDILRSDNDAYHYIGETRTEGEFTLTLTEEQADILQSGVDEIDLIPGKLYVEYRVDLKRWMPGQFGTLDVGIVNKNEIHIWDHKFGLVPVSPVENEQLMIYALGFWDNVARHISDATKFVIHVFQPYSTKGGGTWTTTLEDLLEFGKKVKRKARRTYDPNAERTPGPKQCMYCPGAINRDCPEYDDYNLKIIADDFDDLDRNAELGIPPRLTAPAKLTYARKAYLIEHKSMFEKWLARVENETLDDALKGAVVPGYKAVEGKAKPRRWNDPDRAKKKLDTKLGEEAYTKKLITPTMAEKALPPKQFAKIQNLITRDPPNPVLVPDHDDRPAIKSIVDEFDDLD